MNISYSWLKKYVDTDLSPFEIAEVLTSIGLEVGSVEEVESIKGGLRGVIVAEVMSCIEHPNSDHLHITTINTGEGEPLQVVCGAPNVAKGQKVLLATIGTTLYSGEESFTIKKSKIRGEESYGMLCSEQEIGLGNGNEGIMVLPENAPVGTSASEYFGVVSDYVLEVDITPNRVDATSHYGVARDLNAYLCRHGAKSSLKKPSLPQLTGTGRPISLKVLDAETTPRYSGIVIKGITVKDSPDWLQKELLLIGQKPINNVVDITNYVLHELGQPLHAFDLSKITGDELHVRFAQEGEKIRLLDHIEYTLKPQDLCICDTEKPLCLAGIMGGEESGVTETTRDLFLECANFHPTLLRKTSRRLGVSSDSSYRFERGLDPNAVPYALSRAVSLILEYAGGAIGSELYDEYPTPVLPYKVEFSLDRLRDVVGISLPVNVLRTILSALEIHILQENGNVWILEVPRYRTDVTREIDVIEEILRIYGYNDIPITNQLKSTISPRTYVDKSIQIQQNISEQLVGAGFNEIMNNSLTKTSYYPEELIREKAITLINPLSADLALLRMTMVNGGLEVIEHNMKRQVQNLRLFEFGKIYETVSEKEEQPLSGYKETYQLALWMTGDPKEDNWITPKAVTTPYEMSSTLYNIFQRMGISLSDLQKETITGDLLFLKGERFLMKGSKQIVAQWGVLSETQRKLHDLENTPVFYAELYWDLLLQKTLSQHKQITDIPKFPSVRRDFALLVDKTITFEEIKNIAYKAEKSLLKSVTLFDVYEDPKHLPQDKKSYAVAFLLQDPNSTLSDKVIDKTMNKIFTLLNKELGAELR